MPRVYSVLLLILFLPLVAIVFQIQAQSESANVDLGRVELVKLNNTNLDADKDELESDAAPRVLGSLTSMEELKSMKLQKLEEKNSFYSNLESKVAAAKARETQVDNLVRYLRAQGSPVAQPQYARQIIELSEANGVDYRQIVAIMGVESGFCSVNVLLYNCFGYLNGVRYPSYTAAFNALIPQIAHQYVHVYGTDFRSLAKAYGIVEYEYHAQRMSSYYQSQR